MSRELAPPVFMRHMQHQKDPLPAIGAHSSPSPGGLQHSHHTQLISSHTLDSPPKALDESPTVVVGSLAMARRRARNNGSACASPEVQESAAEPVLTPTPTGGSPTAAPSSSDFDNDTMSMRPKVQRTTNALLDVLDPDTDGSTIVDLLPRSAPPQQRPPNDHYQQAQQFNRGFQ